mmetsp:Transcript_82622/g.267444  ORF Transcript_82622/g.267444 Transcript_82622/m.267444 type:complete len:213 (-) Transcript_82622:477-1115(-)
MPKSPTAEQPRTAMDRYITITCGCWPPLPSARTHVFAPALVAAWNTATATPRWRCGKASAPFAVPDALRGSSQGLARSRIPAKQTGNTASSAFCSGSPKKSQPKSDPHRGMTKVSTNASASGRITAAKKRLITAADPSRPRSTSSGWQGGCPKGLVRSRPRMARPRPATTRLRTSTICNTGTPSLPTGCVPVPCSSILAMPTMLDTQRLLMA